MSFFMEIRAAAVQIKSVLYATPKIVVMTRRGDDYIMTGAAKIGGNAKKRPRWGAFWPIRVATLKELRGKAGKSGKL